MSNKVRIHDLAKLYGMQGKDLATRLRDLGFGQAKSHMTALDEFEVLQARGILEANGIRPVESQVQESDEGAGSSLLVRKKKKKLTGDGSDVGTRDHEAESETAAESETVRAGEEALSMHAAPPPVHVPASHPIPEPEPSGVHREPPPSSAAPAAEIEVDQAAEEEPFEVPEDALESTVAAYSPAEVETELTTADEVAAEAAGTVVSAPAEGEAETKREVLQPSSTLRPKGRVLGFIDPASFQRADPSKDKDKKRTESRRLRSGDEETTPEVQPTFAHDRNRAMLRGAGVARGDMTSAQLRERESGRFLRRRSTTTQPSTGAPGQRGPIRRGPGMRPGGRPHEVTESPLHGAHVTIDAPITVQKLAETLKLKSNVLIKTAMMEKLGLLTQNSIIDEDTAKLLADIFEVVLEVVHEVTAEEAHLEEVRKRRSSVEEGSLSLRTPTVAFLGHVDHGKTTLIDAIRKTRVAEHEAGGITQHIGAYQIETDRGHRVTIIDTPGHAAFTAMRARGARAVDIVVLVIAGDDGIMPHTEEAIAHARAAETPIVIAITKKDKPAYNAQRVMEQLTAHDIVPEDWGGQTGVLRVSAVTGEGIQELLERLFAEGELLELKAHPDGPAVGVVLEAEIQQGKGIVAHLLVQDGTLNRGDVILAGEGYGKVKAIYDDRGNQLESAGPSMPIEVTGLSALPDVSDAFHVVDNLARAKEVAEEREHKNRQMALAASRGGPLDLKAIFGEGGKPGRSTITLIVRADVQGSVGAIKHALSELQHEEVEVKIVHSGVGAITESDVDLAITSNALLVAFHVGVNGMARSAADRAGLEIRRFDVIYELVDHVRDLMEGSLAPEVQEEVTGHVEIRRLFKSSKVGLIAGCFVLDGLVARDSKARLLRDQKVIYTGAIASLRRESDDAREVREGFECGIVLRDYRDIREGDVIETFKHIEIKRTLDQVG